MENTLAKGIVEIKKEFVKQYDGNSHLHEVIPTDSSDLLPIESTDLQLLHSFAKNNPIYSNSFEMSINDVNCIVYEGDINNYWLDSIKHDTSYAPFYPTWILSAYALAKQAKELGITESVDIGSGDGRIAYCCQVLGIDAHGIEIDENLVELQKTIEAKTKVNFKPKVADATQFDYSILNLHKPGFFIGGLPEVGEILANSVIEKVTSITELEKSTVFVLTGTNAVRKTSREHTQFGWGVLIQNFGLDVITTLTLPTRWTIDQPIDTPYVFVTK